MTHECARHSGRTAAASDLSVVIVSYNSARCIDSCLASLREHMSAAEIVIVDNASTDGSESVVRATDPEAILVQLPRNLGFGRACNLGISRATRKHILILNPDVTVTAFDDATLGGVLRAAPFGIVAPLLTTPPDGPPVHHLLMERHWLRVMLANLWTSFRPRETRRPRRFARDPGTAWVAGAMFLVRRSEFESLGGFDPRFFLYVEDVDLCRRYRQASYPIRTTTAVVATHVAGGSTDPGDGLRSEPRAWSLLSWLEYVHIWHGRRAALCAAHLTVATLWLQRRLLEAVCLALHSRTRVARKLEEVRRVERYLLDRALAPVEKGDVDFCPNGRAAIRAAWRAPFLGRRGVAGTEVAAGAPPLRDGHIP